MSKRNIFVMSNALLLLVSGASFANSLSAATTTSAIKSTTTSATTVTTTSTKTSTTTNSPRFELSLGVVYLQPGAGNLGWSATTTVLPIPSPDWHINTLKPSYQPGFNLGARYFFPCNGVDIQLAWTHLNTSDTENVTVDPATQFVSPFSQTGTLPVDGEITGVASLKAAKAKVTFNYDIVNLDVGKYLDIMPIMQVRLFSGISVLNLREELKSVFYGLPKVQITLKNTSIYTGVGPRLGVENIFHVYDKLNIVWQLAGSVLIGRMQPAQYNFIAIGSGLTLVGVNENNESLSNSRVAQVVAGMDTKIGLNYLFKVRQDSTLKIELGWTGALHINPFSGYETNTNVIALDTGSLSTSSVRHSQSNFTVSGPYLIASLAF